VSPSGTRLLAGAALLVVGAVTATVLWMRTRTLVVTVQGSSMEPTLRAGERLLVRRVPVTAMEPGQVVVVEIAPDDGHPGRSTDRPWNAGNDGRYLVKRLAAMPGDPVPQVLGRSGTILAGDTVPPDRIVVLGDNAADSYDSRHAGYLATRQVIGVMIRSLDRAAP
jgi:signal peptidase I